MGNQIQVTGKKLGVCSTCCRQNHTCLSAAWVILTNSYIQKNREEGESNCMRRCKPFETHWIFVVLWTSTSQVQSSPRIVGCTGT